MDNLKEKMDNPVDSPVASPVFLAFCTYATIVILKMMMMSFMTVFFRFSRGAFANLEDHIWINYDKPAEERKKMMKIDPDVERVRRCHQNDLENIIPFVLIGLLYSLTGPDLSTALIHFRVFAASRILHTVAYVCALPQPSRPLTWITGMVVTFSMAYRLLTTASYL